MANAEQVEGPDGREDLVLDRAGLAGGTVGEAGREVLDYRSPGVGPGGRFRWVICGLLFFATTINYLDRVVLSVLAQTLQIKLGWSDAEYGWINFAFTGAYAVGLVSMGWVMDRLGTRRGYAVSVTFWSLAAMGHALARSAWGFGVARVFLALGEGGNFPAAIKTTAEWFPKRERALATGLFNAGANVGAVLAPLLVPVITVKYGWEWAFVATGALGFVWLAVWLAVYRPPEQQPKLSAQELAYIRSDPAEPTTKIPYLTLVPHRQTWAFAIGKFLTDPVWFIVAIFWAGKYLQDTYGVKLEGLAVPLIVIYLAADVGSIGGGWLSSSLLKRGWSVNASRKTAMLICALCVVPLVIAPIVRELWVSVGLLALTAAAHQGWSANLYTLVSDTFPRRAVGSVVGFGSMFGALGGMLASVATGYTLQWTHSYNGILYTAAFAYVVTLGIIHLLNPRLEPARIDP